jgi:hypothetical protein
MLPEWDEFSKWLQPTDYSRQVTADKSQPTPDHMPLAII